MSDFGPEEGGRGSGGGWMDNALFRGALLACSSG